MFEYLLLIIFKLKKFKKSPYSNLYGITKTQALPNSDLLIKYNIKKLLIFVKHFKKNM